MNSMDTELIMTGVENHTYLYNHSDEQHNSIKSENKSLGGYDEKNIV